MDGVPAARKAWRKATGYTSMTAYQFPTDERFRKLAAKLADAVQVAVWNGRELGSWKKVGTYCPMGCLPEQMSPAPYPSDAAAELGCTLGEAQAFMDAFDGRVGLPGHYQNKPWFDLGLAYRRRFIHT